MSKYKNGTYVFPAKKIKSTGYGSHEYKEEEQVKRVYGAYQVPEQPSYTAEELESVRSRLPKYWENFTDKNKRRIVRKLLNNPQMVY